MSFCTIGGRWAMAVFCLGGSGVPALASYVSASGMPDMAATYDSPDPIAYEKKNYVGHVTLIKQRTLPPVVDPNTGNIHIDGTMTIAVELSTINRPHWTPPVYVDEPVSIDFMPVGGVANTYDSSISFPDVARFDTPDGTYLFRESPTLASEGSTVITPIVGDGTFRIDSFFDVFTELSLDNGASWIPADSAARFTAVPEPGFLGVMLLGAGMFARRRRS